MKTKQIFTKLSLVFIAIIGLYSIYSFTKTGNESTTNYDASYYTNLDKATAENPAFNVLDESKCGGDKKTDEKKCGDGAAADSKKKDDSKCGDGKAADESKCGDGKAADKSKCGADKKEAKEGAKESKCGGDKKETEKKDEKCGVGKCG